MAHMHHSTPTAGLEAILNIMPLDLFAQCMAVQAAFRIWGRNLFRWDGIGWDNLWGHLFWSKQHLQQVNLGDDYSITGKRAIKDHFYDSWTERWRHLATCQQTKYWIDVPGSISDAGSCLDCTTLSIVLQAITGHNNLNYHHYIAGNLSEQFCRFCREEREEFIHLVCECSALTMECLASVQGLQLSRQPPNLYGLVRLTDRQ